MERSSLQRRGFSFGYREILKEGGPEAQEKGQGRVWQSHGVGEVSERDRDRGRRTPPPHPQEKRNRRGDNGGEAQASTSVHIWGRSRYRTEGRVGTEEEGQQRLGPRGALLLLGLASGMAFTYSIFIKPSDVLSANSSTEKEGLEMEAGHAIFKWQSWI